MAQRGRPRKTTTNQYQPTESYLDRVNREVSTNQSKLSMLLGALIILVIGVLVFNYFINKPKTELGPAQQTQQNEQDVSPDNLPGKYKVKDGDTLFLIAEKYYKDGYKYEAIVKANNISDPNAVEMGQVLQIPKLEEAAMSPSPSPTETTSQAPEVSNVMPQTNGDLSMTSWGPKITGTTYTVVEGDWLSKIAGRAYGDIFAYKKLVQINHIKNPDLIFPGQVLTIPR